MPSYSFSCYCRIAVVFGLFLHSRSYSNFFSLWWEMNTKKRENAEKSAQAFSFIHRDVHTITFLLSGGGGGERRAREEVKLEWKGVSL